MLANSVASEENIPPNYTDLCLTLLFFWSRSPCPNIYLALSMFERIEFDDDFAVGKIVAIFVLAPYTGLTHYICSCFVVVVLTFVFIHVNDESVINHCH